ncbi:hypothetical protein V8C42DRAFT_315194 [Trichoderma barbatum]
MPCLFGCVREQHDQAFALPLKALPTANPGLGCRLRDIYVHPYMGMIRTYSESADAVEARNLRQVCWLGHWSVRAWQPFASHRRGDSEGRGKSGRGLGQSARAMPQVEDAADEPAGRWLLPFFAAPLKVPGRKVPVAVRSVQSSTVPYIVLPSRRIQVPTSTLLLRRALKDGGQHYSQLKHHAVREDSTARVYRHTPDTVLDLNLF